MWPSTFTTSFGERIRSTHVRRRSRYPRRGRLTRRRSDSVKSRSCDGPTRWPSRGTPTALGFRPLGISAHWVPSGLQADAVEPTCRRADTRRTIGNFHHSARATALSGLLASPLVAHGRLGVSRCSPASVSTRWSPDPASKSSARLPASTSSTVGALRRGARGLRIRHERAKLAEAALAGRAVITTPAGAEGYPPELRQYFVVREHLDGISPSWLRDVIRQHDSHATQKAFEAVLGPSAAVRRYAAALSAADHAGPPAARASMGSPMTSATEQAKRLVKAAGLETPARRAIE